MEHVELILSNSVKFNGAHSNFTQTAWKVVEVCRNALDDDDQHLTELENDIAAAKKAAEVEAAHLIDVEPSTPGVSSLSVCIARNVPACSPSNYVRFLFHCSWFVHF